MIDMTETIDESMTEEMAKKRVRYLKAKEEGLLVELRDVRNAIAELHKVYTDPSEQGRYFDWI